MHNNIYGLNSIQGSDHGCPGVHGIDDFPPMTVFQLSMETFNANSLIQKAFIFRNTFYIFPLTIIFNFISTFFRRNLLLMTFIELGPVKSSHPSKENQIAMGHCNGHVLPLKL